MRKAMVGIVLSSCVVSCSSDDAGKPNGAAGSAGKGGSQSDSGADATLSCENVCCECDYGVLPPDVRDKCCATPPGDASTSDGSASEASLPDALGPDALSCENVCCACEYGVLPPEIEDKCCRDAGPASDAISCTDVCCECDYGILPPEVEAACC